MAPTSSHQAAPFRELQAVPHATFACGSRTGRDRELRMDMFAVAGWALVERADNPQGSRAQRCVTVVNVAIWRGEAARDAENRLKCRNLKEFAPELGECSGRCEERHGRVRGASRDFEKYCRGSTRPVGLTHGFFLAAPSLGTLASAPLRTS
eukprot:scaffold91025_cov35-Phaeocystis_antarctica.AAC.1